MAGLQTGHGSTLAFGTTTTFSPGYTSIGGPGWTRDSIDTSTLATTGARTYIGGDLWGISPIVSTYLLDPSTLADGAGPPAPEANSIDSLLFDSMGTVMAPDETITITLSNTASFSGSGHVTALEVEDLTTDALIAASLSVQFADTPTVADGT